MSFEDDLRRTFEALTERLRDSVDAVARELAGATDELAKAASAERERAAEAAAADAGANAERLATGRVEQVERAANAHIADFERQTETRIAELERAAAQTLDDAVAAARAERRPADPTAVQRIAEGVRAIDAARSLTEILDTLLSAASKDATRVALMLVRGESLRGWRLVGFGFAFDAAHELVMPLSASGVMGDAVRTRAAASSTNPGTLTSPPFALPDGRERIAIPMTLAGQPVSLLYADQGPADDPAREVNAAWPAILEVLTAHAARTLEALVAFKAARAVTEEAAPTREAPRARTDEADESARRYARLLVSEIKMYHEDDVAAGRRERDLGSRLAAEISRGRALYEERVANRGPLTADHFHAELVRTLADGDERLLGV